MKSPASCYVHCAGRQIFTLTAVFVLSILVSLHHSTCSFRSSEYRCIKLSLQLSFAASNRVLVVQMEGIEIHFPAVRLPISAQSYWAAVVCPFQHTAPPWYGPRPFEHLVVHLGCNLLSATGPVKNSHLIWPCWAQYLE
jgi:hypothetical protein